MVLYIYAVHAVIIIIYLKNIYNIIAWPSSKLSAKAPTFCQHLTFAAGNAIKINMHPDLEDTSPAATPRWKQIPALPPVLPQKPDLSFLPDTDDVAELAKAASPHAFKVLGEVMLDARVPMQVRERAATAVIDRAHGRPKQALDVSGEIKHKHSVVSEALRLAQVIDNEPDERSE